MSATIEALERDLAIATATFSESTNAVEVCKAKVETLKNQAMHAKKALDDAKVTLIISTMGKSIADTRLKDARKNAPAIVQYAAAEHTRSTTTTSPANAPYAAAEHTRFTTTTSPVNASYAAAEHTRSTSAKRRRSCSPVSNKISNNRRMKRRVSNAENLSYDSDDDAGESINSEESRSGDDEEYSSKRHSDEDEAYVPENDNAVCANEPDDVVSILSDDDFESLLHDIPIEPAIAATNSAITGPVSAAASAPVFREGRWLIDEEKRLYDAIAAHGIKMGAIASHVRTRSRFQVKSFIEGDRRNPVTSRIEPIIRQFEAEARAKLASLSSPLPPRTFMNRLGF